MSDTKKTEQRVSSELRDEDLDDAVGGQSRFVDIKDGTSNIKDGTSNIKDGTSNITDGTSNTVLFGEIR